jgi:acyl-coenzyme A synthetase/AMP-(fatty) acid ligase
MAFFLSAVHGKIPSVKTFVDVNPFDGPISGCSSFFDMAKQSTSGVEFCKGSSIDPKTDIAVLPFSSGTTGPPKGLSNSALRTFRQNDS